MLACDPYIFVRKTDSRMKKLLIRTLILLAPILTLRGTGKTLAQEMSRLSNIPAYSREDTVQIMKLIKNGQLSIENFPDSALLDYNRALVLSRGTNFTEGIALSLLNIGIAAHISANYEQALGYLQQSLLYSKDGTHYRNITAVAYGIIGQVYFRLGDYKRSARYYDSALRESLRQGGAGTEQTLANNYNSLSLVYIQLQQYDKAQEYLARAETIARRNSIWPTLSIITANKMDVYIRLKAYDSAMACYQEGMALARKYRMPKDMAVIALRCSAAEIMLKQGRPEKAMKYIAPVNDEEIGNNTYIKVRFGYLLGKVYLQLKNYNKAEHSILGALKIADQKNIKDERMEAHRMLSEIYRYTGHYQIALLQHKLYHQLYDSLLSSEKIKAINELEVSYRTAEKDRQLAVKESEILKEQAKNQRQKAAKGIISLAILLLIIIFIFIGYLQVTRFRRLTQQQQLDILRATTDGEEAERLRVGQELHDGVSGFLSAIKLNLVTLRAKRKDIAEEANFITTMELADVAADELRRTAHNLVPSNLNQNGIGKAIKDFCDRVNASSGIPINVQESGRAIRLESTKELVIYRIIQELVHNIIKHSEATRALVALSWQERLLLIAVEDNGTGFGEKRQNGIGLENIRKRIRALNGSIEINSLPGEGTSVYLEFLI